MLIYHLPSATNLLLDKYHGPLISFRPHDGRKIKPSILPRITISIYGITFDLDAPQELVDDHNKKRPPDMACTQK